MKLLLDQGLPRSAAAILRSAGWDAVHTAEIGLAAAEDAGILERARSEGRVVVSLDADFHALLAIAGAAQPSAIRVRIEGLKARELVELLEAVIRQHGEDLERGALMTIQEYRVRVRRLPL